MQLMVVGMHRSGTSMLARLLNLMGVYFAPEGGGTGANQENPKGFWERRDVRALNDFVLHSAGCDWNRVSAFDVSRVPPAVVEEFQARASRIVLEMDANRPWFLKEPRLCLLLPMWRRVLEIPVCVHILRHPVEVAASLRTRNEIPMEAGLALWEAYNRSAHEGMNGLPQVQVVHRDLVRDPVGTVARLHHQLGSLGVRRLTPPGDAEVRAFISPDLYREREGAAALSGFSDAVQVGLFEQWIDNRQDGQAVGLAAEQRGLLAAYEASLPPLALPPKAAEKASVEAELRAKVAAAERQVQVLKGHGQQAQALQQQLAQALQQQKEQALQQQQAQALQQQQAQALQRDVGQARKLLAAEQEANARLVHELEVSERARFEVGEALANWQARATKQSDEIVKLARLLLDTNSALGAATAELDAVKQEHADCVSRRAHEAADASLRAELQDQLGACVSRHAQETAAASSRIAELQRELVVRDDRISGLLDAAFVCGAELGQFERQFRAMRESASWRATAPMRWLRGLFNGPKPTSAAPSLVDMLRHSPWFDADWYSAQHPEAAECGLSPEVHFLARGALEGANPSRGFDTRFYLERNPDVATSGRNPLLHFIQFGEAEGRLPAAGDRNQ